LTLDLRSGRLFGVALDVSTRAPLVGSAAVLWPAWTERPVAERLEELLGTAVAFDSGPAGPRGGVPPEIRPGEVLVAADAPQDGLQLLLMGRASSYEADGARLRQYGPGDAIGVRGAFEVHAAPAATVADEPCRTLTLTPVVRRWLEENREHLMLDLYGYLLTAGAGGEDPPASPVTDDR